MTEANDRGGPRIRVRVPGDRSSRVTTFELFFDLVYVFAFTQVSAFMVAGHDATAVVQGLVVLGLLWWTWVGFAWVANRVPADQPTMIGGMAVAMMAVFVIALAVPESFADAPGGLSGPLVLAIAYTVVRLVHVVLYAISAGDDEALRRQIVVFLGGAMVPSVAALIVGALLGGQVQLWVWLGALVYDLAVTRLSSRSGGGWGVHSVGHWAERHGLVVILALGESIVAIGIAVAREPISVPIIAGSVTALLLSFALWWSYFGRFADAAEHELERRTGPRRVTMASDVYSYTHAAIVAGVIITALGVEQAMAYVAEPKAFGWFGAIALFGGVACLSGAITVASSLSGIPRAGLSGASGVAALVLIPVAQSLPPLAALALATAVVIAGVAVVATLGRRPASTPASA